MNNGPAGPVMVLSAAVGAGHVRAAEALAGVFTRKGINAVHIEVLRHTNPLFRKAYADLYLELVNKRPELLGWIYKALDRPWQRQKRRLALDLLNMGPFIKLLKKERPSIAVCTHFLPAEILLYLRRKNRLDIPVGIVVTDFDVHALWLYKDVDWYFVAGEETRAYLTEIGIPDESIHVTGIPIDSAFDSSGSKRDTRERLGLDTGMRTVLIAAGGFGVGPVASIVQEVNKVKHPVQIIIICGKNEKLRQVLNSQEGMNHPVKVVGYTDRMHEWMAASDLLVGKPGGLTSSEALASGVVMVIFNPVPGQEERNSDHFLEEGAAVRCNNLPTLSYKIDSLLADANRLSRMRQTALRIARPHAASDIVSIVMNSMDVTND